MVTREFAILSAPGMRLNRKVVVGHYQDPELKDRIAVWARAAAAFDDARNMKVARFGDNMREVAVTEGNKGERPDQDGIFCLRVRDR